MQWCERHIHPLALMLIHDLSGVHKDNFLYLVASIYSAVFCQVFKKYFSLHFPANFFLPQIRIINFVALFVQLFELREMSSLIQNRSDKRRKLCRVGLPDRVQEQYKCTLNCAIIRHFLSIFKKLLNIQIIERLCICVVELQDRP